MRMLQHAAHRKDIWHFLIKDIFHWILFSKASARRSAKHTLLSDMIMQPSQKCFSYAWFLIETLAFSLNGKNTIPIHFSAKRPRIGTIMKNHIQSSSYLFRTDLFVCSESDIFLMNYITLGGIWHFFSVRYCHRCKYAGKWSAYRFLGLIKNLLSYSAIGLDYYVTL